MARTLIGIASAGLLVVLAGAPSGAAARDSELNAAHDTLQKQDLTSRKRTLAKILQTSGRDCRAVTRTFYQGFDSKQAAYWNARCSDGLEYLLQFPRSKFENIRIVDCATMAEAGMPCFERSQELNKR